jgi:hypothetical protein
MSRFYLGSKLDKEILLIANAEHLALGTHMQSLTHSSVVCSEQSEESPIFWASRVAEMVEIGKHFILFHHLAVILALLMRAVAALGRVPAHVRVVLVFTLTAYPMLLYILRWAFGLGFVFGRGLRGNLLVMRLTV